MSAKIGGYQPCPCAGGKKYNDCCGKSASGAGLNQLYDRYQINPNDQQAVGDLFQEIRDYAHRIVLKGIFSNGWRSPGAVADDVVQTATLNIWKALATFKSKSKFSTWCYRIVQNAAIDTIRSIPEGATELLPWKAYTSPLEEREGDGYVFRAGPLSKSFLNREENRINADIDLRETLRELNPDDREIAELFFVSRCKALEIAKMFGKDTKRIGDQCSSGERWVQNRIAVIRMAFKTGAPPRRHDGGRGCLKLKGSCINQIELEHELDVMARLAMIVPSRNPDGKTDAFDSLVDASSSSGRE